MDIQSFKSIELVIPLWQLGLYTILISFFMLFGHDKHGISVSFGFILYWGFVYNRTKLNEIFGTSPSFMAIYIVCAILLIFLILISFFIKE